MARTDTLDHYLTDVASAIKTKLGSQTPILASEFDTVIASIPSGSTGLEYETGTYTPTADISRPTISFTNQHTTVPAVIVFTDTSSSSTLASGAQLSFIFVSYSECVDASVYEDNTETIGILYYRYKGTQNYTGGAVILKPNGTGSNDMAYWATNSAFFPSTYSQTRYWIANRTYEWIAIWNEHTFIPDPL